MKELRALLPDEKSFVKKLADLKGDLSNKNLQNFQSGRILESLVGFNFAAIKWDKDYKEPIKIYYEDKSLEPAARSSFFVLCDYLFLLEELESAGLIVVQSALFDEKRILYNRKKYQREQFDNWVFNEIKNGFIIVDAKRKEEVWNINIVNYLEKYVYLKVIYPKAALVSFVNSDYRTPEQVRHDEIISEQQKIHDDEMKKMKEELKITKFSFVLSTFTLFATIGIGIWNQLSPTTINSEELKTIAISSKEKQFPEPPNITIIISDTNKIASTTPTNINN